MFRTVKRLCFWLLCGLMLALLAAGVYEFISPIAFTEEHLDKIQDGMTEAKVEAILGVPAGNYCGDQVTSDLFIEHYCSHDLTGFCPHKEWLSDDGMIRVWFEEGRVVGKEFFPPVLPRRSLPGRIKGWFTR